MKLAVIAPPHITIHIETMFHPGYYMALGQHLVKDELYFKTFVEIAKRGAFIIVDNGAAEPEAERVSFEDIIKVCGEIDVDEVILPDVLGNCYETLNRTVSAARKVCSVNRMIVPQGKTWDEWWLCFVRMTSMLDSGFASIGLPKHLESLPGGRAHALHMLREAGAIGQRHVHMLGISTNNWRAEVSQAIGLGIRGIDTGFPVAYAQQGIALSKTTTPKCRCSLDWSLDEWNPAELDNNIQVMTEFCYGI
jgi:hypothetical protein